MTAARLATSLLLACLAFVAAAPEALACSCGFVSTKKNFEDADVVFWGQVVNRETDGKDVTATMSVEKVYKGELDKFTFITTPAWGPECGAGLVNGLSYTVYARKSDARRFSTTSCSGTRQSKNEPKNPDGAAEAVRIEDVRPRIDPYAVSKKELLPQLERAFAEAAEACLDRHPITEPLDFSLKLFEPGDYLLSFQNPSDASRCILESIESSYPQFSNESRTALRDIFHWSPANPSFGGQNVTRPAKRFNYTLRRLLLNPLPFADRDTLAEELAARSSAGEPNYLTQCTVAGIAETRDYIIETYPLDDIPFDKEMPSIYYDCELRRNDLRSALDHYGMLTSSTGERYYAAKILPTLTAPAITFPIGDRLETTAVSPWDVRRYAMSSESWADHVVWLELVAWALLQTAPPGPQTDHIVALAYLRAAALAPSPESRRGYEALASSLGEEGLTLARKALADLARDRDVAHTALLARARASNLRRNAATVRARGDDPLDTNAGVAAADNGSTTSAEGPNLPVVERETIIDMLKYFGGFVALVLVYLAFRRRT